MKLKIDKYIIKEDNFWYQLYEYRVYKEWKKVWEEYIWDDVLYPATLSRALMLLSHKIKKNKEKSLELQEYAEEFKKINKQFLKDINKLLKEYDLNEDSNT